MAFKKTQSTSFNPATIQVNRGQGLRQLGASIGELGSANSRGVNNFINNRLNEMEVKEKKLGKKLGKQAQIIYEDQTFTDENGNTRTHKIASNYATPEELLSTSWSASAYDEEAADTYVKAVSASASKILDDEKLLAIQNVKYSDTVGEHIAMFDESVAKPMEALLSTVPPEMRSIVETDFKNQARIRRTDLANKQLTRRIAYDDATATNIKTQWADIAPSLALSNIGDYTEQLAQITKRMTILANKQGLNSTAAMWLENELPTYQLLEKTGENLSKYILHNNKETNSLARVSNNIQNMRMGINNPTQTITLQRPDGSTENVTFKSLGFGKVDGLDMTKVDSFLTTHKTFIDSMLTQANDIQENMINLNEMSATGLPKKDLTKTQFNKLSTALSDFSSDESTKTISEFAVTYDKPHITGEYFSNAQKFVAEGNIIGGPSSSENVMAGANEIAMYDEWLIGNKGLMRDVHIKKLKASLSAIPQTDNAENLIIDLVNSQAFVLAQSAVFKDRDKNITSRSMMSYLKLEEAEETTLNSIMHHMTNNAGSPERGAQSYERARKLKDGNLNYYPNKDALKKAYKEGKQTSPPLDTVIDMAISTNFADKWGSADIMTSNNFVNRVKNQIYFHFQKEKSSLTQSDIQDKVYEIGNRMMDDKFFGPSKFVIPIAANRQANSGGFFNMFSESYGAEKVIVQSPIDHFMEVSPSRKQAEINFGIKYDAVGTGDKTQTYRLIQDDIENNTQRFFVKNKQFLEGEKLELGVNCFFEVVNAPNINRVEQSHYVLKFYKESTNENQTVFKDNGQMISYTYKNFEEMYDMEGPYFGNELKIEKVRDQFYNLRGPNK